MKLLLLYGPPGVGKLTIASRISLLTGYKLFDNQVSIDFLTKVFAFGSPSFGQLNERIRLEVIEEAARAGVDLIFTYVYAHPVDQPSVEAVLQAVESNGGEVLLVRLYCDVELLYDRVESGDRGRRGKLASARQLSEILVRYDLTSPLPGRESLEVDNSDLDPDTVAEGIVQHLACGKG